MAIFKCKICGGTLEITDGASIAECEYCGTKQTLPRLNDDRKINLYDRANHFRRNNEYDKAEGIYEQILNDDTTDAEAYWSLVLCRYGIEYVEDPSSHKRLPTVNRAQYTSVFADENYKKALEYADAQQRELYEEEARAIDEIQKGILEISAKEEPFDVFICYKETDANGRRTPDSVLATDLYHQLTNEGFKVFFSRITLEDKLGTAYEPYIFAALNSAKVMVALGTRAEYFNAVWVKNEWSRYLALIRGGAKKTLIPAYRDMDPYDLPEEFSHLQAQDMSKLGFMQDLIRGIKKILDADKPQPAVAETVVVQQNTAGGVSCENMVRRGNIFLEEKNWDSAKEYFNRALDIDAEYAEAYLGLALAEEKKSNLEEYIRDYSMLYLDEKIEKPGACEPDTKRIKKLSDELSVPGYLDRTEIEKVFSFDFGYTTVEASVRRNKANVLEKMSSSRNLVRAEQYANEETKEKLNQMKSRIVSAYDKRIEKAKTNADEARKNRIEDYQVFLNEKEAEIRDLYKAALERRDREYESACKRMNSADSVHGFEELIKKFASPGLAGYKESKGNIEQCKKEIKRLEEKEAKEKKEKQEKLDREIAKEKAKKKKIALISSCAAAIAIVIVIVLFVIIPNNKYKHADDLFESGSFVESAAEFEALGSYKDSIERVKEAKYAYADKLFSDGDYDAAIIAFDEVTGYNDAYSRKLETENEISYQNAEFLFASGSYEEAADEFSRLGDYKDSAERMKSCHYEIATDLYEAKEYDRAIEIFELLGNFEDSVQKIEACQTAIKDATYESALALKESGDYDAAIELFKSLSSYKDCETQVRDTIYVKALALKESGDYEAAIELFRGLYGFKDSTQQLESCKTAIKDIAYEKALALKDSGDYEAAIEALEELDGYRDSATILVEIGSSSEWIKICPVGKTIYFGAYEQDNDTTNGKESIEWLVLEREDDRILVISNYALDCKPYNTTRTDVTWETCSLRRWLNGTFLNAAFSAKELAMIPIVTVNAEKNPEYKTNPGNDTLDRVYLLSIKEANKYFSSDEAKGCQDTPYCYAQGAKSYAQSKKTVMNWWLRSPGSETYKAAIVGKYGYGVNNYGAYVNGTGEGNGDIAVRPVIWISLE